MLEREFEKDRLRRLLRRARDGQGTTAIVRGPAGIGKTRLLDWTERAAREAELAVLRTRCGELESDFAFGAARSLFEPVLERITAGAGEALVAGAAGLARSALDPAEQLGATVPGIGADPAAASIHGLYWLTVNLADERPLVLVLDDLQWADPPTLRFVDYLGRRVEDLPVLLLMAFRTGEGGTSELARTVAGRDGADVLEPPPLSDSAVGELITDTFGEPPAPEFLDACVAATAGNPFLVAELVATLARDGIRPTPESARSIPLARPESILQTVLVRLARLSGDAQAIARAVAVLGDGVSVHRAATFAGIGEERAAQAADDLAAATMLALGLPLEFVHPLVRSAVYEAIRPAQRALAHARAAELLASENAPLDATAAHLMNAEPRGASEAVQTLRAAGRAALGRGAPDAAVSYLRRALAEPPSREDEGLVLAELGSAETLAHDSAGVDHLAVAYDLIGDPDRRAQVAIELGRGLMMSGRLDDAIDRFEQAIALLDDPTSELSLRLEADLINAARLDIRRRAAAAERLARIADGMTGGGAAERLVLANVSLESAVRGEPAERTAELARLALGDGALLAEETSDAPVYYLPIWALAVAGRFEEAEHAVAEAIADARARGASLGFTIASCFGSNVFFRMGRLADAEASARAVLDVTPEQRWALGLPMAISFLLDALVERGDLDSADEALREGGVPDEIPELPMLMPLLFSRGKLRLAQGETEAGMGDLLLCGERAKAWGSRNPTFLAWRAHVAPLLAGLGEGERAQAIADEDLTLSRAARSTVAIGIALRTAGLLAGGEAGERLLTDALSELEGTGARLEQARALVELGALRRRSGHRASAREPLAQGRELAHACGATVLERRAHDELLATGSRPRRLMLSGLESLTPSERRVARLAAAGHNNTDIAQALFITRKTVEKHLGGAYSKLGLQSRTQLPEALAHDV
jgi:DNA-binding CsgD family transcriptional regulator/tetratricopeptide (TPR) repeat protein